MKKTYFVNGLTMLIALMAKIVVVLVVLDSKYLDPYTTNCCIAVFAVASILAISMMIKHIKIVHTDRNPESLLLITWGSISLVSSWIGFLFVLISSLVKSPFPII